MADCTGNNPILARARYPLAILGSASALALAGCFSGGSSSSGDGDSNNGDGDSGGDGSHVFVTLDRLDGLDVEQTRDELLFYRLGGFDPGSDEDFDSGLRAIHPERPHDPVEFDVSINSANLGNTTPVIAGVWNQDDFDLTGIERALVAAKVSELDEAGPFGGDGVATIGTESSVADAPGEAIDLVGEQQFLNAFAGVGFVDITQSPGNINAAQLLVGVENDNFFYSPGLDEGEDVPAVSSESALGRSLVSIRDIADLEPIGWVAVQPDAIGDENTLQFLDTQGDSVGNITVEGTGDTEGFVVDGVSVFGEILPDGAYYLLIEDEGNTVAERQLRRYTPDPNGGPGTVEVVTDESGNVVDMEEILGGGFLGGLGFGRNRIAHGKDSSLFFSAEPGFFSGVTGNTLYRVEGTTLETVVTSGDATLTSPDSDSVFRAMDSIIWITDEGEEIWTISLDGTNAELIADEDTYQADIYSFYDRNLGGLRDFETPIRAASETGWIFYTAESTFDEVAAVMHNLQSGEVVAIDGAEWVGSSSDGSLGPAGFLGQGRLSEAFLIKSDGSGPPILGVVDAADPLAGMVELGALPDGAETVQQGHATALDGGFSAQEAFASGPHRLFRAELEGDNNAHVIHVDVREENSLEAIVNSASPDSYPVSGY